MFGGQLPPVPARIEGTILVSGSEANGDYWGPGDLNPYEQFLHRQPDALIANSILVFHGQFDVPLLTALSHASHAQQLASRQELDQALTEAALPLASRLDPRKLTPSLAIFCLRWAAPRRRELRFEKLYPSRKPTIRNIR